MDQFRENPMFYICDAIPEFGELPIFTANELLDEFMKTAPIKLVVNPEIFVREFKEFLETKSCIPLEEESPKLEWYDGGADES